jgi:23S rRNA-/tRNA-specific pseudouridylate synthase
VEEGRVFVGRVRVGEASYRVRVGDEVKIGGAGAGVEWAVIWERDGLLACNKPAGIPTVADHVGASHALVALAAEKTGRNGSDLFVTSRLDREVSGVVVLATSAEAEARLRTARQEGRYARRYVAIAVDIHVAAGTWSAPIGAGKDPRHRAAFGPDAKAAQTRWRVVARAGGFAMLAVAPQTGRTHQIRVHASHAGAPLLGDRDYGGPTKVTLGNGRVLALARIALHAARVTVPGQSGAPLVAEAPIPSELARIWAELGGEPEAWNTAVSCELEA